MEEVRQIVHEVIAELIFETNKGWDRLSDEELAKRRESTFYTNADDWFRSLNIITRIVRDANLSCEEKLDAIIPFVQSF